MEYVLETKNLTKYYSKAKVLNGVDMHVEKGAIYGLIGKNGAGKTTIIRILCGLQPPTRGYYKIFGIGYDNKDILKARRRMGAIVETPAIYTSMSAEENLLEEFKLIGNPNLEEIQELLKLVGLNGVGRKKVKNFSLGMKQRLAIAVALSNNPDLIILDEPTNGLDPEGIIDIRELIISLNRTKNITFLVSSHYLDELSKIATHYGFLDRGRIIEEISSRELSKKMQSRIEFEVKEPSEFVKFFESKEYSYKIEGKNKIDVYGKVNLSKLVIELAKKGLVAEHVREHHESLENYYMNLLGGEIDD